VHVTAVIPARYASARFPGKPLARIAGKPMIQWVYEAACAASSIDRALIATDDDRIAEAAVAFGAACVRTPTELRNGTERVAAVMRASTEPSDLWLNVQGDEPLLTGQDLDALVEALRVSDASAATLAVALEQDQLADANCVKVVRDVRGDALYFSRAPIPYARNAGHVVPLLHVGVYALRRDALERYARREPTPLELAESLEQLRLVEHGERMAVVLRESTLLGVDTPDDLREAEAELHRRSQRGRG
jgi:3-deoxy-manno-octulosonate cytidylyltransferase (CMP-KDO synthetase)